MHKNVAVRRIMSRSTSQPPDGRGDYIYDGWNEQRASRAGGKEFRSRPRSSRRTESSTGDTAWLNEFPRGNWLSSTKLEGRSSTMKTHPYGDGYYTDKKRRVEQGGKVDAKKTGSNDDDGE